MRVRHVWRGLCDLTNKAVLVIAAVFLTLFLHGKLADRKIANEVNEKTPLTKEELRRWTANFVQDYLAIQQQGKETKVYSNLRRAQVTEKVDGTLDIEVPNKGWVLEPGLTIASADGLRFGLDTQFAYWKRWGLLAGFTIPTEGRTINRLRLHTGISYSPTNKWFPNTSIYGGIDTNASPIVGVRTRF